MLGFLKSHRGAGSSEVRDNAVRILDAVSHNVMFADENLVIRYINPSLTRFLKEAEAEIRKDLPNFEASKLVGQSIDVFHKNPAHQRRMLGSLRGSHTATIRIGGRVFDLAATSLQDEHGRPSGFVTEWSDASLRIANAELNAQFVAVQTVQAVIEFELDGTVITANQNFLDTLGYDLSEIKGRKHSLFVEPAHRDTDGYRAFWDALRRGEYQAAQYKRIGKNGREVWIEASYNPIFDHTGKPYKVVKFATDITAQVTLLNHLKTIIDQNFTEIERALDAVEAESLSAAAAAEETQTNASTVAAAAEEMAATAREIADNMQRSRQATESAVRDAEVADGAASRLTEVAKAMGGIVDLIRSIAGQINLLALNATIEAARAGEAGRGFAVVAGEVKNLANQSANATAQIAKEIEGMQSVAGDVVRSLSAIRDAMGSVRDFVTTTAGAVEEQSAVTNSMSSNMQAASGSVSRVAGNIDTISSAVLQVNRSVMETKEMAEKALARR